MWIKGWGCCMEQEHQARSSGAGPALSLGRRAPAAKEVRAPVGYLRVLGFGEVAGIGAVGGGEAELGPGKTASCGGVCVSCVYVQGWGGGMDWEQQGARRWSWARGRRLRSYTGVSHVY